MNDELRITIQPDWQEMERVNATAEAFFSSAALPPVAVDAYTMVVCELAENSIKYGCGDALIEVAVRVAGDAVGVRVKNRVGREAYPHLQELDRTLQKIRGVQDPYQAYLDRVREISREPLSNNKSGLGLVRIAYEGGADIDFVLHEDGTLHVSAVARL